MLPSTVPSEPIGASRSTSVEKLCSGPYRSRATAVENSFIVDAGCIISPAFWAKSVSPRVSEVTITPNRPLRMRVEIIPDRSVVSAGRPLGDVHAVEATGVAARARVRRVGRRDGRFAGVFARDRGRLGDWNASGAAAVGARTGAGDAPSPAPAGATRATQTAAWSATRSRRARRIRWCIALGGGNSRSREGRGATGDRSSPGLAERAVYERKPPTSH